jgi:hypothetical protein
MSLTTQNRPVVGSAGRRRETPLCGRRTTRTTQRCRRVHEATGAHNGNAVEMVARTTSTRGGEGLSLSGRRVNACVVVARDRSGRTLRVRTAAISSSTSGEDSSSSSDESLRGSTEGTFGNPDSSGFSDATSAGAKPLFTDQDAKEDAAARLAKLESLTVLRELYSTVVDCEANLADDYFIRHADDESGEESSKLLDGKKLSEFAVPSPELEEAISALEEMLESMKELEAEKDKLRSAATMMDGKWEILFEDADAVRDLLTQKFSDCADRVEDRCREMSNYLPYESCERAERALQEAQSALEAAQEDAGESQVGARLRPLGRKVGRITSRGVRSAGVLGEGLTQLRAKPRESIANVAEYSQGVWARINGLSVGETGVVEVLKSFPVPRVSKDKRDARILRLLIEVQDRDKALTEAQKTRDGIMAQGRSSLLSRVALGDKIRECDEKVSTLRRVFAVRTLQMEMERIILALEEELATPPDRLSKAELNDMQLMVAEFGVMDLSLRRLISLVDRQESQLIDDEDLSKLAMEIPDMKLRLAIRDDNNAAMSMDLMRERFVLTMQESGATIREGGTFLFRGVKLLGSDIGTSLRLFMRAAFGTTLRPREVQVVRRTFLDVFTFVPFMIILITPITPVGHVLVFGFIQRYFPQLFPSQFTSRRQELMQKYEELKEQLAVAEEAADAANESEALRRAVAAVSSVKSMISGAVSDVTERLESASEQVAAVDGAKEQQRLEALRTEIDQTSARLAGSDDDDDEEKDDKND